MYVRSVKLKPLAVGERATVGRGERPLHVGIASVIYDSQTKWHIKAEFRNVNSPFLFAPLHFEAGRNDDCVIIGSSSSPIWVSGSSLNYGFSYTSHPFQFTTLQERVRPC